MKKLILTLCIAIASYSSLFAQWTTGTVDINNTNNGNVGIGTTSPSAKLHIREDGYGVTALKLTNRNNNQTWGMAVDVDAVDDKKFMIYDVNISAPRFTINTSGNVGIGTTTPLENLSVIAPNNSTNQIGFGVTGEQKSALYHTNSHGLLIYSSTITNANHPMHFLTGGVLADERMTILGNGNVGIGTTAPVGKFDISDGNGAGIITYLGASNVSGAKGIYFDRNGSISNPINIQGTEAGIGVANISLQAGGGNVGIGTTSPASFMHLLSPSSTLTIQSSGSNGNPAELYLTGGANNASWAMGTNHAAASGSADNLYFYKLSGSAGPKLVVQDNGNVGIGTTSPTSGLTIATEGSNYTDGAVFLASSTNASFGGGATIAGIKSARTDDGGYNLLKIQNATNTKFLVTGTGDVGIGTPNPDAKLAVNGTIHSKEVKVDMNGWSDYVFEPSYDLPSLISVKAYIDKNHRLPEMPSTQEVLKNGINLGEIMNLQMKKIEELTLYLIEQQKINQSLQSQINQLKSK